MPRKNHYFFEVEQDLQEGLREPLQPQTTVDLPGGLGLGQVWTQEIRMSQVVAHVVPEELTGEELMAMGELGPCELIDGKIMPMSPTGGIHARIESALGVELTLFVRQAQLGWVLVGEVGIYTRRTPDRVRGADLAFLSRKRAPAGPPKGFLDRAPELVVEIASPGDRWEEMQQKIEEYLACGVDQVWVIEPENRTLRAYNSAIEVRRFTAGAVLHGEGALAGFSLAIDTLFSE